MTRIILVRHCEAQGNVMGLFQGSIDSDISRKGEMQLDLLSVRCRNMSLDAIYSSPLKRARKTAEAINRFHNLSVQIEPDLREIDGGVFEGKSWKDLPALYPEQVNFWYHRPCDFAPENGEPMRAVYERIWNAVTKIVGMNEGKTVCVVSHGGAIRNFLCHALNKPIERLDEVAGSDNTAVSVIDFDENMHSTVVSMNDTSHLTPEASASGKSAWWKQDVLPSPCTGEDR